MSHRSSHTILGIRFCPSCRIVRLLLTSDKGDEEITLGADSADMLEEFFYERSAGLLNEKTELPS